MNKEQQEELKNKAFVFLQEMKAGKKWYGDTFGWIEEPSVIGELYKALSFLYEAADAGGKRIPMKVRVPSAAASVSIMVAIQLLTGDSAREIDEDVKLMMNKKTETPD